MKPKASSQEREETVAAVAGPARDALSAKNSPLVINDRIGLLALPQCSIWNRHALGGVLGREWPEDGPFDGALIRMLHDKSSMRMAVSATAGRLLPGSPLYVVGANDEGTKSIGGMLSEYFDEIETLDTRKRCRVIKAHRSHSEVLRPDLEDWMRVETFSVLNRVQSWVSWPGVFAKGCLDDGTSLLIDTLQSLVNEKKIKLNKPVLDFGCGIGVLSSAIRFLNPDVHLTAIDVDAISVCAAKRNVPDIDVRISDSWSSIGASERFGLVISNPPVHSGKSGDFRILDSLLAGARNRLLFKGALVLVVQRHLPIQKRLQLHFKHVEMLAENTRFWVWRAA